MDRYRTTRGASQPSGIASPAARRRRTSVDETASGAFSTKWTSPRAETSETIVYLLRSDQGQANPVGQAGGGGTITDAVP